MDKMQQIAEILNVDHLTAEQLADEFLHARDAIKDLQEAVQAYFDRKSMRAPLVIVQSIEKLMTDGLWKVKKYFNEPQKRQDAKDKAANKAK